MRSAFLVFDLVGGTPVLSSSATPEVLSNAELNDSKETVGLIVGEKSESSSGGQNFAKGNGSHPNDFVIGCQLLAIRS
jgi:hypothetical protein